MINKLRFLLCCCCFIFSATCLGDSFDDAGINWAQHNPDSTALINHQLWNDFLIRYMRQRNGINLLDYARVTAESKIRLNRYIDQLAAIKTPQYNRHEQKAYWINLYNALTIRLILDDYPIDSIKSVKLIKLSVKEFSPWDRSLVTVNNVRLTLNHIEHQILRVHWQDARTHYALNCASIGCPNLTNQAYTSKHLDAMLEQAARAFINHPRAVRFVDSENLKLSSIYQWYREDFGINEKAVLRHLESYAEQPLAGKLANFSGKVEYQYDWRLNDFGAE